MTGKKQFQYFLKNPQKFPRNYKTLEEDGFKKLVAFLMNMSENEASNIYIPESMSGMYYYIVKGMEPKKGLVFVREKQIDLEYIFENSHIEKWLMNVSRKEALELINIYQDYHPFVLRDILCNINLSKTDVVSYIKNKENLNYLGNQYDCASNCIYIMEKRNLSRPDCLEIFNYFSEKIRQRFFYDEFNKEISYFSKILSKEKLK